MEDFKIQAIVKVNGENLFYLYDEDIKRIISSRIKNNLELKEHKVASIEVELNSPPLTVGEIMLSEKLKNK